MLRVRFAPSPTGFLHIGSARTALFNWLAVAAGRGEFILRIEDTNLAKCKEEYLAEILDSLKWLGISWHEGPIRQSERRDIYVSRVEELLSKGLAYKDEGAIRLKGKDTTLYVKDLVYGDLKFDTSLIGDLVLMKSDGYPAYNFACVVDDIDMEINCIIRGADHISNLPKQILVYEAIGEKVPECAHIPLVTDISGARLSKRKGATSVSEFRQMGILSDAMFNYLALLGCSYGDEILKRDEIESKFRIHNVKKSQAAFNLDKLKWINSQHIKMLEAEEFVKEVVSYCNFVKKTCTKDQALQCYKLFRDRISLLSELFDLDYIFSNNFTYDEKATKALTKESNPSVTQLLTLLKDAYTKTDSFDAVSTEQVLRDLAVEGGFKAGCMIHPLRAALTGCSVGPSMFDLVEVLGKDEVLARINKALDFVNK